MIKNIIKMATAALLLTGCGSHKQTPVTQEIAPEKVLNNNDNTPRVPVSARAHVIIYRMNGDYANLVPITLNDAGTQILSYPAVSDIRPSAKPEYLTDGWYLDHRGVNYNTAFTSYTYDEYHKLPKTPTQSELMNHIVARKAITEIRDLGTERLTNDSIVRIIQNLKSTQP